MKEKKVRARSEKKKEGSRYLFAYVLLALSVLAATGDTLVYLYGINLFGFSPAIVPEFTLIPVSVYFFFQSRDTYVKGAMILIMILAPIIMAWELLAKPAFLVVHVQG